ncbi:CrcB family protein [Methanoregula sp.]|jgi:fluoride exporter|uniref:CrcB family protein n=1 Tax=Methanoregula sp. TaxID=2052170 RepID=UPI003C7181C9
MFWKPARSAELVSCTLIFLGGMTGSVLRFVAGEMFSSLPGTLFVNTLGSFFMGIFMYESIYIGRFSRQARMLAGVGFLGGFTTFSTLAVITVQQPPAVSAAYFFLTLACGLGGILAGRSIIVLVRRP